VSVDFCEQALEIGTGEGPFERLCDLAVVLGEGEQPLGERLLRFGDHYRQIAKPFEWTFTRTDLERLLARIDAHEPDLKLAA